MDKEWLCKPCNKYFEDFCNYCWKCGTPRPVEEMDDLDEILGTYDNMILTPVGLECRKKALLAWKDEAVRKALEGVIGTFDAYSDKYVSKTKPPVSSGKEDETEPRELWEMMEIAANDCVLKKYQETNQDWWMTIEAAAKKWIAERMPKYRTASPATDSCLAYNQALQDMRKALGLE